MTVLKSSITQLLAFSCKHYLAVHLSEGILDSEKFSILPSLRLTMRTFMKKKQTVLFLTEISFYPVFGGEQLRTYGLLKILSQTFDRVYALTDLQEADENVRREFPNVHFHAFDYNQVRVIIRGFGYFVQFRKDERFLEEIEKILTNQKIDLVFIDYKYYGQYIGYFRSKGLPVIYGTHNVQSRIMWQKPADSLRMYLRYKIFYLTHYLHEKIYFPRADKVLAVSQHDARYYGRYMDRSKIVVLPNFLDEELYRIKKVPGEEYIIMTGNFLAFQNETGIDWFVGNVWSDELAGQDKTDPGWDRIEGRFSKALCKIHLQKYRGCG